MPYKGNEQPLTINHNAERVQANEGIETYKSKPVLFQTGQSQVEKAMNRLCFFEIIILSQPFLTELIYPSCCHNERLIGAQGNNSATEWNVCFAMTRSVG